MGTCSNKEDLSPQTHKKRISKNTNIEYDSKVVSGDERDMFEKEVLSKAVKSITNASLQSIKIIFRASENNFDAEKFHEATDGISNTILLVKTKEGKIFGGFTTSAWEKGVMYSYKEDKEGKSFIFGLRREIEDCYDQTQKEKTPGESKNKGSLSCNYFKLIDKEKSIMNNKTNGPIFGEGHDIFISDKCNIEENWCNLGKSYNCDFPFGSNKANRLLGGENKFLVKDYEILALIL